MPNLTPDLTSLQVLVVEDEAITRTALTILLEQLGAQVFAVGTIQEAIEAIATNLRPDLVLCNLRLPDGHGTKVLQAVCQQDEQLGRRTPTIILSGETPQITRLNSSEIECYQYLSKPFESRSLIDAIQQAITKKA